MAVHAKIVYKRAEHHRFQEYLSRLRLCKIRDLGLIARREVDKRVSEEMRKRSTKGGASGSASEMLKAQESWRCLEEGISLRWPLQSSRRFPAAFQIMRTNLGSECRCDKDIILVKL